MVLLLAAVLAVQDVEVIRRTDRIAYEEALDLCRKAEERIATEPGRAVESLSDLIDKRPLRKMECLVRIEVFADSPGAPVALFPYQLRGRARQSLAAADGADRRKLLEQALQDFETSTARGVTASARLARDVRRELLALLRPDLDPALPPLLRSMEADQQAAEVRDFAAWLAGEAAVAERRLDEPGNVGPSDAAKVQSWCDRATSALQGLRAGENVRAQLAALRTKAAARAAYKGSIRLKISASPYAEVVALRRDGKELALPERLTPLRLDAAVEIGDLDVELRHPQFGRRSAAFPASSLKDGARYVLTADMEKGILTLSPLP